MTREGMERFTVCCSIATTYLSPAATEREKFTSSRGAMRGFIDLARRSPGREPPDQLR
jgi:hypothetical protein